MAVTSTRFADRAAGRALRIPPPTTDYVVHRGVRIEMRDGVHLVADHYAPITARPLGTILVRGPYGRGFPFSFLYAQIYAARGYHVVFQSVRGTFGSGGEFVPMLHEADDAADSVAWLRDQPWFTGTFGTVGLSYLGFTQWALLTDPPPELATAVISVGPHDLHNSSWGTGSFALNDFLGWSDLVANQERSTAHRIAFQFRGPRRLAGAVHGLPLGDAGRTLLGEQSTFYESWLAHPDADDPFWDGMRVSHALDRCTVPVLLMSGWQDVFIDQTIAQYRQLRQRGADVAMTIGPWTHDQMVTHATGVTAAESLAWLGAHLAGDRAHGRPTPVRIFITGRRGGWVNQPDWPPSSNPLLLYPRDGGTLGEKPAPGEGSSTFRFDPADPTPTVGGRLLARKSGYTDDTALAARSDVLSFTGAPLESELTVCGTPHVELDYATDNPHFDVFVRVSEVDARGRSRNVGDGFRRFTALPEGPLRLEIDPIAHRFSTGSRIRLIIAGGCHPRFARNLGTGEEALNGTRMIPSTHTVRYGDHCALSLPVTVSL